ncbi:transporter substrate-binding domain-containing protein [Tropicibacter sp. S64]|uniref:transporter substrate-binding domain-containing protein n=1 Tax=Tropicibacter sp. S64 TaxID=3415122 RepID=UPI003C7CA42C
MLPRLIRVCLACLLFGLSSHAATAQEDQLTVPWAPVIGIYEDIDGTLTGFFADLANAVARRAGFTLEFKPYPTRPAALAAQARGETNMMAGVVRLPILEGNVVFSDPLAEMPIYLFVLLEPGLLPPSSDMTGKKVGFVRNTAGSNLADFGGAAVPVAFDDPSAAFAALLVGQVDGVVALHKIGADFLQKSRLDYRIQVVEPPLRTEAIHVVLSPDKADLMPRVNAALNAMIVSGEMEQLLRRWNMIAPEPAPDVLTVGVTDFPPYQVIDSDGQFTGFGVESLREIARLAGLRLRFVPISTAEWQLGPVSGLYDMLPPISVTQGKQREMDFTIPVQQSPYAIFLPAGSDRIGTVHDLDDLTGLRVGVMEQNIARERAEAHGGLTLSVYTNRDALIDALLTGTVDAILFPSATTRSLLEERGQSEAVHEVFPPFHVSQRAVALRFGLPEVRERLNAVIPGYLSSEAYLDLRQQWLGEPVFWTAKRIRWAQGLAAGTVILLGLGLVAQALRGKRRAQQQARDMRRITTRLSAILNTTRSAIVGLHRDGRIAVANPGAVSLLGLDDGPWPVDWPRHVRFVEPETNRPLDASADPMHRALAGATMVAEHAILQTSANHPARLVRISSAPVEAQRATDVVTVLSIEDVTEQENTRQQAERAGRLDALGQLTGGVAHDFNNILATIQYAAQLAETTADETQRKYLEAALGSVKRGEALTRRLLTFAKRQPGQDQTVRVADAFADLQSLAQPLLEKSITLTFRSPDPALTVTCDLSQLENALLNLVLNSRDAILEKKESGTITVSARSFDTGDSGRGTVVEIAVRDDGPGMPPSIQRRAIDPFFTTKSHDRGTGLGLSMVYGFVEHAGGDMRIDSAEGVGTTVTLRIPQGAATVPGSTDLAPEGVIPGQGETILIVEDELKLLELTAEAVRAMGYTVLTATNGQEALDLIARENPPFDVLLTDVVMPQGVGGFELARRVRASRPEVPVVYMSGYTGIGEANRGDVVGPVLGKPCAPDELSRTLRRVLSAAQA